MTCREVRAPDIQGKAVAVIGMRRAGKTSFLHQCRADLLAAGHSPGSLLYFNFEDERLAGLDSASLGLITATFFRLFLVEKNGPFTLFLDEIQQVPGWEKFARRMLDTPHCRMFLSGFSARMLSREIATSMRGRAWETVIQPFNFREWLCHHQRPAPAMRRTDRQRAGLDADFARYVQSGGFPEAQTLAADDRRQLLQGYVDVLLLRDVAERHPVANFMVLRWLVRRLLSNAGGLFSITRFAADCKSQGLAVGRGSLYEYLGWLEDTFLLQTLPVWTDSEKRRQVNPRKIYPADPALIPVFDRSGKTNAGHALETVVFNALRQRGAESGYVRTKDGLDVDFLACYRDGSRELLQVCASVDEPETLAREVRALQTAARELPPARQRILTLESRLPFPDVPGGIEILPAWQWLLDC